MQWGGSEIPTAMAPWIKEAEDAVLPPPTDTVGIEAPKELNIKDSQEAKRIYRDLARRFHPDLVREEDLQVERREVMAEVNEAYQSNDIDKLRHLRHHPDIRDKSQESPGQQWERLVREIAMLNQRVEEAEDNIVEAKESDLAGLMERLGEDGEEERFSDIRQIFSERLGNYREQWQTLRQREAQLWLDVDR